MRASSPRDHAIARMVRRTLEEGFYFVGLYSRWQSRRRLRASCATRSSSSSPGSSFRSCVACSARSSTSRAPGVTRTTRRWRSALRDLDALAELLGDRPFLLGEAPRTIDCTVFGFLEATLGFPLEGPLRKRGESHANLVAYRQANPRAVVGRFASLYGRIGVKPTGRRGVSLLR